MEVLEQGVAEQGVVRGVPDDRGDRRPQPATQATPPHVHGDPSSVTGASSTGSAGSPRRARSYAAAVYARAPREPGSNVTTVWPKPGASEIRTLRGITASMTISPK